MKIKSEMLEKSSKSHAAPELWKMILYFIIVFLIIALVESLVPTIAKFDTLKEIYLKDYSGEFSLKESMERSKQFNAVPGVLEISLLGTISATLISMFYCRCIEIRSLASMGVTKKKAVPSYLLGMFIGMAVFSLIVLISAVTGVQRLELCDDINWKAILIFIPCWFLQGMSEEFTFRGYLMTTVGGKHSPTTALIVSSLGFALAHSINPGFNLLVLFNLALFGLFAGLYMLLTDNIWGVCAIHSVWNCVQGNFYGISVSGMEKMDTVFRSVHVSDSTFLTGGDFGMEGSIFTTIVLGGGCYVIYRLLKKKNAEPQTAE